MVSTLSIDDRKCSTNYTHCCVLQLMPFFVCLYRTVSYIHYSVQFMWYSFLYTVCSLYSAVSYIQCAIWTSCTLTGRPCPPPNRQASSSHHQLIFGFDSDGRYLSNSTKRTTNTETAMLSRLFQQTIEQCL